MCDVPTDHAFRMMAKTAWVPQVSEEDAMFGGPIEESRQEVFCCRKCGHTAAMLHVRPMGATFKDKVGSWRAMDR